MEIWIEASETIQTPKFPIQKFETMTPEEYERFKEAEKEHLRKLKKLKEAAHQNRRRASINRTLGEMASAIPDSDDPLDAHNEMLDKLQMDTARQEARLEMALESAALKEIAAEEPKPSTEELEEAAMKQRAKNLVEQMKLQMGMTTPDTSTEAPAPTSKTASSQATPETEAKPSTPSDRPEKTIGRMK